MVSHRVSLVKRDVNLSILSVPNYINFFLGLGHIFKVSPPDPDSNDVSARDLARPDLRNDISDLPARKINPGLPLGRQRDNWSQIMAHNREGNEESNSNKNIAAVTSLLML